MQTRYATDIQTLIDAILNTPGETPSALRLAVRAYAAQLVGVSLEQSQALPYELEHYVSKVALHAYRVTDQDIEELRKAGYSEEAIFEITLSAALGAGMAQLAYGLVALKGGNNAPLDA